MGIKRYNSFVKSIAGQKYYFSREELFGDKPVTMALDCNLVYFRLVHQKIFNRYSTDFDFVLRNMRVAYIDGRFRVYQDKQEHKEMTDAGMFEEYNLDDPELKVKMDRRIEYFDKLKNINQKSMINDEEASGFKSEKAHADLRYASKVPDNQLYRFARSGPNVIPNVSTEMSCPYTEGDGLVQAIMQDSRYNGLRDQYSKLGLDMDACSTLYPSTSEGVDEKYVEIFADDIANDIPLFTTEVEILIESVNLFLNYAEQLEIQNIKPVFVWDQSVFGASPAGGNNTEDFGLGSKKLRNVEKMFRSHCDPSRYIMFLTALELVKHGYSIMIAVGEGELFCTYLQKQGIVDCIDTADTDALVAGAIAYEASSKAFRNSYMSLSDYPEHVVKVMLQIAVPYCNGYDFQPSQLDGYGDKFLVNLINFMKDHDKLICNSCGITTPKTDLELIRYFKTALNLQSVPYPGDIELQSQSLLDFYGLKSQSNLMELPITLKFYPRVTHSYHYAVFDLYAKKLMEIVDNEKDVVSRVQKSLSFPVFSLLTRQVNFNMCSIKYDHTLMNRVVREMRQVNTPPLFYRRSGVLPVAKPVKKADATLVFLPSVGRLLRLYNEYRKDDLLIDYVMFVYSEVKSALRVEFADDAFFSSKKELTKFFDAIRDAYTASTQMVNDNLGYPTKFGETWNITSAVREKPILPFYSSTNYTNWLTPLDKICEVKTYPKPVPASALSAMMPAVPNKPRRKFEYND